MDFFRTHEVMVLDSLFIFIGAGIGGVLRYWISNGTHYFFGKEFPYGTFVVNVSGCFLMGLFFTLFVERFNQIAFPLHSLLLIGLLGGYTTFSSFSLETIHFMKEGDWLSASLNIFVSVCLCILAVGLGILLGKQR